MNAIGSIEEKTLLVFCIMRIAWHQNIFDAVTVDVPQAALLSCLNSEPQRSMNLHLNASRILDHVSDSGGGESLWSFSSLHKQSDNKQIDKTKANTVQPLEGGQRPIQEDAQCI